MTTKRKPVVKGSTIPFCRQIKTFLKTLLSEMKLLKVLGSFLLRQQVQNIKKP